MRVISLESMQSTVLSFCKKNPGALGSSLKVSSNSGAIGFTVPHVWWQLFSPAATHFHQPRFLHLMRGGGSMGPAVELIPSWWSGTRQNHVGGQNSFQEAHYTMQGHRRKHEGWSQAERVQRLFFYNKLCRVI